MLMEDIRKKAEALGIQPWGKNKFELIREIQRREGFNICYGSFKLFCPYASGCCFSDDCMGKFRVKASVIFDVK